jgi:ABC-type transporter Mla subunit MlaD
MAKSVEQRIKDLVEPTTRAYVAKNWAQIVSSFSKELSAPIFKKLGDIAPLAKRYDAAGDTFIAAAKKKDEAKNLFNDAVAKLTKLGTEIDGLKKELDDVFKDESASLSVNKEAKTVEEYIDTWEERVKGQQDMNKMRKVIFDRWMKLSEEILRVRTDASANVKKAAAAAQAAMASSNNEMNATEAQMRAMVINYQKTALDMDRKDIADEVRGLIVSFGR